MASSIDLIARLLNKALGRIDCVQLHKSERETATLQDFTLSGAGGDPFATVTNVYQFTAAGPSIIIYLPTYTKTQAYLEALKPFTDIAQP